MANHPEDATEIEKRISNGEGLLSPGGASISNIFTGDGDRAFLVMSAIKVKERGLGQSNAFAMFFLSPYNYLTMIANTSRRWSRSGVQSFRQKRAGSSRACTAGFPYPWVRAATNVALRSLGTWLVVRSRRCCGARRSSTWTTPTTTRLPITADPSVPSRSTPLTVSIGELRTLAKAARNAPRPYRFVYLADHGQSLGATFLQRYGLTLQDLVKSLMGGDASVTAATEQIEDWGQLNTFLTEVSEADGVAGSVARTATQGHRRDGSVALGPRDEVETDGDGEERADLVVVAGGNLGLIDRPIDERLMLEQIEQLADRLDPGAQPTRHRRRHGPAQGRGFLRLNADGVHCLDDGEVEGVDPLASYGEHAVASIQRLDAIEHVGDIAVISQFDPETGESRRSRSSSEHMAALADRRRGPSFSISSDPRVSMVDPLAGRAHGVPAASPLDGRGTRDDVRQAGRRCGDSRARCDSRARRCRRCGRRTRVT